jgi:hypothetical protein
MSQIEDMAILLATCMAVFTSLLPVVYIFWSDRFVSHIRTKAGLMHGLGTWMHSVGTKEIDIRGNLRIWNPSVKVDIEEPSDFAKQVQAAIAPRGTLVERDGPNYDARVIYGLNKLANLCARRSYVAFVSLLVLFSSVLVFSMVSIVAGFHDNLPSLGWVFVTLLSASAISFVVCAAVFLSSGDVHWSTDWWSDKDTAHLMNDTMWEGMW